MPIHHDGINSYLNFCIDWFNVMRTKYELHFFKFEQGSTLNKIANVLKRQDNIVMLVIHVDMFKEVIQDLNRFVEETSTYKRGVMYCYVTGCLTISDIKFFQTHSNVQFICFDNLWIRFNGYQEILGFINIEGGSLFREQLSYLCECSRFKGVFVTDLQQHVTLYSHEQITLLLKALDNPDMYHVDVADLNDDHPFVLHIDVDTFNQ